MRNKKKRGQRYLSILSVLLLMLPVLPLNSLAVGQESSGVTNNEGENYNSKTSAAPDAAASSSEDQNTNKEENPRSGQTKSNPQSETALGIAEEQQGNSSTNSEETEYPESEANDRQSETEEETQETNSHLSKSLGIDLNITTAKELYDFALDVNSGNTYENQTILLSRSVDISGYADWPGIGTLGSSAGNAGTPFKGTFMAGQDEIGNYYEITGLSRKTSGYYGWGLFGYTDGANIMNVRVRFSQGAHQASADIGGLVGKADNGTVLVGCIVDGNDSILSANGAGHGYAGGLVGSVNRSNDTLAAVTIKNCEVIQFSQIYNAGTSSHTGGLIGYAQNVQIDLCSVHDFTALTAINANSSSYTGGLIGELAGISNENRALVTNCSIYDTGAIIGTGSHTAGLVGKAVYAEVENCKVYNLTTEGNSVIYSLGAYTAGLVGEAVNAVFKNCQVSKLYGSTYSIYSTGTHTAGFAGRASEAAFTDCEVSDVIATGYAIYGGNYTGGFVGGTIDSGAQTGMAEPPKFKNCYVLGTEAKVSVSGTGNAVGGFVGGINDTDAVFLHCEVRSESSHIEITSSYRGIGGFTGSIAADADVSFQGCKVAAQENISVTAAEKSGGFIGEINQADQVSIAACRIEANQVQAAATVSCAGGFIGSIWLTGDLAVSDCEVFVKDTLQVKAGNYYAGGFVGYCYDNMDKTGTRTITDCGINAGTLLTVSTNTYNDAGGFGGYLDAHLTIDGCYVKASDLTITARLNDAGGFVGTTSAVRYNASYVMAQNSLKVTCTGTNYAGGFAGIADSGAVFTDCYIRAAILSVTAGSSYAGGFVGFVPTAVSFKNSNVIADQQLSIQANASYAGGYAGVLTGQFELCSSSVSAPQLDVAAKISYAGGLIGAAYAPSADTDMVSIYDSCLNGGNITVSANASYSGGLIAACYLSTTISSCHIAAASLAVTTGDSYTGGFVGVLYDSAAIADSDIKSDNIAVTAKGPGVGGFAGNIYNSAAAKRCYVKGNINVSSANNSLTAGIGGFAGKIYNNALVMDCYASSGRVSGSQCVGGFAGHLYDTAVVTNCYAQVDVAATGTGAITAAAGGFAGYMTYGPQVKNCYANGSVTAANNTYGAAGGFVGYIDTGGYPLVITNSYATGTVSAHKTAVSNQRVGGFLGYCYSGNYTFTSCYFDTTTTRQQTAVGEGSNKINNKNDITGLATGEMIQAASYDFTAAENTFGQANRSGSEENPWYIDEDITYPYLYYQYDDYDGTGLASEITNYYIGGVVDAAGTSLGQKRADFYMNSNGYHLTFQLSVLSAGAAQAYFPYSGSSLYPIQTASYQAADGGNTADDPWSLGGVSNSGIVAFSNGPYTTKSSDRETWVYGSRDTYTYVGDEVVYTIEAANYSTEADWNNVIVTDPLAPGVTLKEGTVGIRWRIRGSEVEYGERKEIPYYDLAAGGNEPAATPCYTYEKGTGENEGRYILKIYIGDFAKAFLQNDVLSYPQCIIDFTALVGRDAATVFAAPDTWEGDNIRNIASVSGTLDYGSGDKTTVTVKADDGNTDPVYNAFLLEFTKADAGDDTKTLSGAVFSLYQYTGSGEPAAGTMVDPAAPGAWSLCRVSKNQAATELVSNAEGLVSGFWITEYPCYYMLVETAAPDGYALSECQWLLYVDNFGSNQMPVFNMTAKTVAPDSAAAVIDFQIITSKITDETGREYEVIEQCSLANIRNRGSVTIHKTDDNGRMGLDGAAFLLEQWDEKSSQYIAVVWGSENKEWLPNDAAAYTGVTETVEGQAGVLVFDQLKKGKYRITEVVPPKADGVEYSLMAEPIEVEIPYCVEYPAKNPAAQESSDYWEEIVGENGTAYRYYYYDVTFTIADAPVLNLPGTGNAAGRWYILLAGALVFLTGAGISKRKKKNSAPLKRIHKLGSAKLRLSSVIRSVDI